MTAFGKDVFSFKGKTVDMEEELLRPYAYIISQRVFEFAYTKIPDAFQYWLKIPDSKLEQIKDILKMYYHFTALSDDMLDNSILRRTVPASHCVFGTPLTLNSTYHVLGLCMEKILKLDHPEAMDVFTQFHLHVMRGQGEDIYLRENHICPTEDQYIRITEKKSSAAFVLVIALMQLFSKNKKDYNKIMLLFGIHYTIRDDYCNLMKQEGVEGKHRNNELKCINDNSFCEDMTDGKYSWPVIHALQYPEAQALHYILKQQSRDMAMKLHFRSVLERLGSMKYTCDTLDRTDRELREEIARFGGNPVMEELLDMFKDWSN